MSNIENELNYLINPQYQNQIYNKNINKNKVTIEDISFYRKRIIQTLRNMLDNNKDDYSNSIKETFDNFVKECVKHFKTLDTRDLIQSEFDSYVSEPNNYETDLSNNNVDNNKLLFNNKNSRRIEDCMKINKITNSNVKKEENYPQKKSLDLKNPSLKLKGVKKKGDLEKKNIQ